MKNRLNTKKAEKHFSKKQLQLLRNMPKEVAYQILDNTYANRTYTKVFKLMDQLYPKTLTQLDALDMRFTKKNKEIAQKILKLEDTPLLEREIWCIKKGIPGKYVDRLLEDDNYYTVIRDVFSRSFNMSDFIRIAEADRCVTDEMLSWSRYKLLQYLKYGDLEKGLPKISSLINIRDCWTEIIDTKLKDAPFIDVLPSSEVVFDKFPCTDICVHRDYDTHRVIEINVACSSATATSVVPFTGGRIYSCARQTVRACYHMKFLYKGDVYISRSASEAKYRPLLLSDLVSLTLDVPKAMEFILEWFDYLAKDNPFYKDVKKVYLDYVENHDTFLPIKLSDVRDSRNWNQYFRSHYKMARQSDINFNKLDPYISYVWCKTASKVSNQTLFLQMLKKTVPEEGRLSYLLREHVARFDQNKSTVAEMTLRKCYEDKFKLNYSDLVLLEDKFKLNYSDLVLLRDWISLCLKHNKKVSLNKTSIKKIREEHDQLTEKDRAKKARAQNRVIVPKNSRFNKAEKMLHGYERIKTLSRLIKEGQEMHHCVASYEDKIAKDNCAIFSKVSSSGTRHTIELVEQDGNFIVRQAHIIYNDSAESEIVEDLSRKLGKKAVSVLDIDAAVYA